MILKKKNFLPFSESRTPYKLDKKFWTASVRLREVLLYLQKLDSSSWP